LEKNTSRGKILGAEKFAAKLRLYVPVKTGKLKRSIVRKKGVVRIGTTGNNGFPYVHWINQTTPEFVTLNLKRNKRTGKFANKYTPDKFAIAFPATYGLQPANWNWTGRVGFVKIALAETRKDWQVLIQKINKKSIMGESI
jgi:hypothetical protein